MKIASTAIGAKGEILSEYTADGQNINPPLTFSEIPDNTQSLVLVMDDPDAPNGRFVHWVLFDMPPSTLQILENTTPLGAKTALNDFGQAAYGGPKPPSGTHRYVFHLLALDAILGFEDGVPHQEVESAANGHVLGSCELVGTYSAKN